MKTPYMNAKHALRSIKTPSFERHIAELDAIIAQRRAALIHAEGQNNGYIWH